MVKARIEAEDRASATVEKVGRCFKRMGTSIKANALKITAALGAVVAAFRELDRAATLQRKSFSVDGRSFPRKVAPPAAG